MAVSKMTAYDWQGAIYQKTIIENPTWEQIEMAIQSLNHQNLNDLYLHINDNTWLCIGGGDGQYLLTGAMGDDTFPMLVDDKKLSLPKIPLTVGGQTGDYPSNWLHDLSQTLIAVRDFYDSGGYSANVNWINV